MTGNLVGFKNKEAAFKAMKEKLGVDPNSKFNSKSITVLDINSYSLSLLITEIKSQI